MIYVVIPAYNEALEIGKLLDALREVLVSLSHDWQIIVVNDGSSDNTAKLVDSINDSNITLLNHHVNKGVHAAFRTGFEEVLKTAQPDDILVTMEGDGTSEPRLIPSMLDKITDGADVVLASCYRPGGKVVGDPLLRLLMSITVNRILKMLYPIKDVYTYTSFYRAVKVSAIQKSRERFGTRYMEAEGFVCMADLLLKLRRLDLSFAEVPLILVSREEEAVSKLKVWPTIAGYLKLFLKNPPWR